MSERKQISAGKRLGRRELPPELLQSEVIRERVRESVKDQYDGLGGKAFLLESIRLRANYVDAGSVLALVKQVRPDNKPARVSSVDVTVSVLALGKEAALKLKDDSPAMIEALTKGAHCPRWVREGTAGLKIAAHDAIARFFERVDAKKAD